MAGGNFYQEFNIVNTDFTQSPTIQLKLISQKILIVLDSLDNNIEWSYNGRDIEGKMISTDETMVIAGATVSKIWIKANVGTGTIIRVWAGDGAEELEFLKKVKMIVGPSGDILKIKPNGSTDVNVIESINLMLEISRGNVSGMSPINKFGHNPNVGNSALEDIWNGSEESLWPSVAEKVNVNGTDSNDTSGGTGARTIQLFGLDSLWNRITEILPMGGLTSILSLKSYLRLYRAKILTAGSAGHNLADIHIIQETSGIKLIDLPATQNQSQSTQFSVPADHTLYIIDWFWGLKAKKSTDLQFSIREFGSVFQVKKRLILDSSHNHPWLPYLPVLEKSDIRIRAQASTGSHEVSSGYNGILVANN